METSSKNCIMICILLEVSFGQSQFHGHFSFIGFVNYPPPESLKNDRMLVKSRLKCSSMCFTDDDCYFFDFCKTGNATSCYLHGKNDTIMSLLENGECQRYGLKQSCDIEYTSPCRCPSNVGAERCKYKYNCNGNLVDWNTPTYQFSRSFPNSIARDLLCEMNIDNGGWIVIQRRVDGSTDFYRNWNEYENGFGNLATNFYLGNYYIHEIVKTGDYELRVDLQDQAGEWAYAGYRNFFIGESSTSYILNVSGFYGDAGDSLALQNGMKFTTYDRDNDNTMSNCAVSFKGAWWYRGCHYSNLNGQYGADTPSGIIWFHWKGFYHSLIQSQMIVRKKILNQL